MDKSKILEHQANSEDNDLKALGLYNKAMREERLERWKRDWLDKFRDKYLIMWDAENETVYVIITSKFGSIDFYPKANKCLIRKGNKWQKPGLNWLINNLLKNN